MTLVNVLIWIALGAVAGLIASAIMKSSLGLLWCIILGIAGSFVGGYVASLFGLQGTGIVSLLIAIGGACLLLLIVRLLRRA